MLPERPVTAPKAEAANPDVHSLEMYLARNVALHVGLVALHFCSSQAAALLRRIDAEHPEWVRAARERFNPYQVASGTTFSRAEIWSGDHRRRSSQKSPRWR